MSEELKPTSMAFEKQYDDNSGVEFGVSCDGTDVTFEYIDKVSFPVEEIGWLIKCLMRLNNEMGGLENEKQEREHE